MKNYLIKMLSLIAACLVINAFAMEEKKRNESTDKKDNYVAPKQKKKQTTSRRTLEAENRILRQQANDADERTVTVATSGLVTSAALTTIIPAAKNQAGQPKIPNEVIISYDPNHGIHPEYQR